MDYTAFTVRGFVDETASPAPVPGGGGVSALAGALAISLGDMVGELTVGKKKYAGVEGLLRSLMARSIEIKERLLQLINEDAENFAPLAEAYAVPKDTPGRDELLEQCLKTAAKGPQEIFDLCCEVIDILEIFGENGSTLMISDAATGASLARGALMGAAVNVKVNTRLMKDRAYAEKVEEGIGAKLSVYEEKANVIFEKVWQRF